MDFERQITALLLFSLTALTAVFASVVLWPYRRSPGILAWVCGIWLASLGILLIAVPSKGWDMLSVLVRNEAFIVGTTLIAIGSARFLYRPPAILWAWATVLAAVPFLLHWIPGIPDFAGRGGIVSVGISIWLTRAAWLWCVHGRTGYRGTALFAGALFASHALFHAIRAIYFFGIARPALATDVGLMQSITYGESALYLVVLGITLWMLANLRDRPIASEPKS